MITTEELMHREVQWYRKNGKYPLNRISVNTEGRLYVIGDFSWNTINPDRKEYIESSMCSAIRK